MKEHLQLTHALHYHLGRWRNEGRIARSRAPDPVLAPSKLTWVLIASPPVRQKDLMDLANQPVRKRKALSHAFQTVIKRGHIVRHLLHILNRDARHFFVL